MQLCIVAALMKGLMFLCTYAIFMEQLFNWVLDICVGLIYKCKSLETIIEQQGFELSWLVF
mgnify:FL=1